MRVFLAGVLLALWILAWGELSVANVVSGIVLIGVMMLAFPSPETRGTRVRVHPVATLRLLGYVLVQLMISNLLVAREIVSRRSRVRTGVVAYHVQQPSDLTMTIMSNIIALAPGTMPVNVTRDPPVLSVHFLLLSDVEDARRTIGRLEALVTAAIETRDAAEPDVSPAREEQ